MTHRIDHDVWLFGTTVRMDLSVKEEKKDRFLFITYQPDTSGKKRRYVFRSQTNVHGLYSQGVE